MQTNNLSKIKRVICVCDSSPYLEEISQFLKRVSPDLTPKFVPNAAQAIRLASEDWCLATLDYSLPEAKLPETYTILSQVLNCPVTALTWVVSDDFNPLGDISVFGFSNVSNFRNYLLNETASFRKLIHVPPLS